MNRVFATTAALCAVLALAGCGNAILPEPPQARHGALPVAGASNVRDIGGLAGHENREVRRGMLVRSGELDMLAPEGSDFLFGSGGGRMGIGTVVDFRCAALRLDFGSGDVLDVAGTSSERTRAPGRIPGHVRLWDGNTGIGEGATMGEFGAIIRNPDVGYFDDVVREVAERYRNLVTVYRGQYLEFFRAVLAGGGSPVLFHCSTGRDRTGVAAALLLLALGVDEECIADDYMLTLRFAMRRYLPVEPAVVGTVRTALFDKRPDALALYENVDANRIDQIEAGLGYAARQRVLRAHMQGVFSNLMEANGPPLPSEAVAEAMRETRNIIEALDSGSADPEIQALRDEIEAYFNRDRNDMLAIGEVPEADFRGWAEDFAVNAGRKISPRLSVFRHWIEAALDEVQTLGGMEVFLDDADPDMSGAEVMARLREWFLD